MLGAGTGARLLDRRYRRLFADRRARRRYGPRFAPRLDRALWDLAAAERVTDRALGRALRWLRDGGRYRRLGFVRWADYVRERVGVERRWTQYLMRLDLVCERVPELGAALGALGVAKAIELGRIVGAEMPVEEREAWIARARGMSVRALRREVEAARAAATVSARGSAGGNGGALPDPEDEEPGRWLRIPAPARVGGKWQAAVERVRRLARSDLPPSSCFEFLAADRFSSIGWPGATELAPDPAPKRLPARGGGAGASGDLRAVERLEAACAAAAGGWTFLSWVMAGWEVAPELDPEQAGTDPWALDEVVQGLKRLERELRELEGELLQAQAAVEGWRWLRFASFEHYLRERLGMEPRRAERQMRFARALKRWPALRRRYQDGELSYLQVVLLVRVVHPQTAEAWAAWAAQRTLKVTERAVEYAEIYGWPAASRGELAAWERTLRGWVEARAARRSAAPVSAHANCSGSADPGAPVSAHASDLPLGVALPPSRFGAPPTIVGLDPDLPLSEPQPLITTIRLWCPDSIRPLLRAALDSCRSPHLPAEPDWVLLERLLDAFLDAEEDPELVRLRARYPSLERDGWRCSVPTCTARADLHSHHIELRSQGGSDDDWNRTTLCAVHHLGQEHGTGAIRVTGVAPDRLDWELGRRPKGGPPLLRFIGEVRIDAEPRSRARA